MLALIGQFKALKIRSQQTNKIVGELREPIINPDNLFIPAFKCVLVPNNTPCVIHIEDMLALENGAIIINDESNLMDMNDLVRLKEIEKLNFSLIEKPVRTKSDKKVGKVLDYAIEDTTFYIQKLTVAPTFTRGLTAGNLMIDRSQVYEVTNKKVVINDIEGKEKSKSTILGYLAS